MRARPESYATTKIVTYFHDTKLSEGATGFIYKFGKSYSLVTNWHVLAGINPITKVPLAQPSTFRPNRIKFHVVVRTLENVQENGDEFSTLFVKPMELSLDPTDGVIWWEGNSSEGIEDVALIPLDDLVPELANEKSELYAIHGGHLAIGVDESGDSYAINMMPEVSSEVFILGYPQAQSFQNILPIWKRGNIASEPLFSALHDDYHNNGILYVDASTNAGMSGSPVLYYGHNFWSVEGRKMPAISRDEPFLVGVYAGRDGITELENQMALGRVWKAQVLDGLHFSASRQRGGVRGASIA